jgi:hypothetical protein
MISPYAYQEQEKTSLLSFINLSKKKNQQKAKKAKKQVPSTKINIW